MLENEVCEVIYIVVSVELGPRMHRKQITIDFLIFLILSVTHPY
jgi:hypothetical protein